MEVEEIVGDMVEAATQELALLVEPIDEDMKIMNEVDVVL